MAPSLRTWIATAGTAVLAVPALAAAYPAAAVARRPGTTVATRPPAWRAVRVPSAVDSPAELNDVSATGPADAWAVGADADTGTGPDGGTPLILHWNGRAWSKVPLRGVVRPGQLDSVSARSRSDAWALGIDKSGNVLLHWNGARWSSVAFPGRRTAGVFSVAAARGLLVIVPYRTLYLYYNGTGWSTVPGASVAPASAFDVGVVTAHIPGTDATWAVGGYGTGEATVVGRGIIEYNPG
jgi:hypothetical protein